MCNEIVLYLYVFVLGSAVGSFLNVCIYRIPLNISVLYPASHCTVCKKKLGFGEMIPIFSYIILKGQCAGCKTKFSPQYCIVEIVTALLAVWVFMQFGFTVTALFVFIFLTFLIVIAVIDFYHQLIYNNILAVMMIFAVGNYFWGTSQFLPLEDLVIGGIFGGAFFLILALLSNGGMGGGDIKLMAVLGFWLGWQLLLLVAFVAFVVGALIGITMMIFCSKKRKSMLPFAPFLAIGAAVAVLYGNKIIAYYWLMM